MIDIFDNYTTKSSFNSINTLLQNQINSISGNVKYITSTLQGGIRNTVFNSNIKILNVNNTTTNTYISNDPNVTTYFRSDVDMLSDLTIYGNMYYNKDFQIEANLNVTGDISNTQFNANILNIN